MSIFICQPWFFPFNIHCSELCSKGQGEKMKVFVVNNLSESTFLLQMMCTLFTVHDFNNCLKFYGLDILQLIFFLSFCCLSNFHVLWLVREIMFSYFLSTNWSRLYGQENSHPWFLTMHRCFSSIPEMCMQIRKVHFEESCKCLFWIFTQVSKGILDSAYLFQNTESFLH